MLLYIITCNFVEVCSMGCAASRKASRYDDSSRAVSQLHGSKSARLSGSTASSRTEKHLIPRQPHVTSSRTSSPSLPLRELPCSLCHPSASSSCLYIAILLQNSIFLCISASRSKNQLNLHRYLAPLHCVVRLLTRLRLVSMHSRRHVATRPWKICSRRTGMWRSALYRADVSRKFNFYASLLTTKFWTWVRSAE